MRCSPNFAAKQYELWLLEPSHDDEQSRAQQNRAQQNRAVLLRLGPVLAAVFTEAEAKASSMAGWGRLGRGVTMGQMVGELLEERNQAAPQGDNSVEDGAALSELQLKDTPDPAECEEIGDDLD